MRTQVGIVGAGPAGLMLGHLLHLAGIDSIIIENRAQDYVIERVRAGVLEQGTVDLLIKSGVGARLEREGLLHDGIYFNVFGNRRRIDMASLTGRRITVYGQNEVVKDLIAARNTTGRPLRFEVSEVSVHDLESEQPKIRFAENDDPYEIRCDFIAGCDGFHGICRDSIPSKHLHIYERNYPFGWLGILANATPSSPELVYSLHERGFASSACVRVTSPGCICSVNRMKISRCGLTIASGVNFSRGCRAMTAGNRTLDRLCKRASPACAAL